MGVLERGFTGLQVGFSSPLYWPLRNQIDTASGPSPAATLPLDVFARLRPGMTVQDATARLEATWPHVLDVSLPAQFTGVRRDRYLQSRLVVTEASTGIDYYGMRRGFEKPFRVLLAISIAILLVSSINIANLLLTRGAERRRDVLVRSALGASRWRLLREALAESGVLLAAGVIGGLVLSYWSTAFLVALYGRMVPLSVGFAVDIAPDRRVFAFTMGMSAVAFLVFGAIPAWTASKSDVSSLNAVSTRLAERHQRRAKDRHCCPGGLDDRAGGRWRPRGRRTQRTERRCSWVGYRSRGRCAIGRGSSRLSARFFRRHVLS